MNKRTHRNFLRLLFYSILTFQISIGSTILLPLIGFIPLGKVEAAGVQTVTYGTMNDTFVSPATLNPANGNRRSLFIGTYTDYTVPGDPVFSDSKSLIKFGSLSSKLPPGAIIKSAKLKLWHYGTNPGYDGIYVARVTEGWGETTVWEGPNDEGNYGSTKFPYYNSNVEAQPREINLNTSLINQLLGSNNGIAVKNNNHDNPGVVVCSSNIPSGPCLSGMDPQLEVQYIVNQRPDTPNPTAPKMKL